MSNKFDIMYLNKFKHTFAKRKSDGLLVRLVIAFNLKMNFLVNVIFPTTQNGKSFLLLPFFFFVNNNREFVLFCVGVIVFNYPYRFQKKPQYWFFPIHK